MMSSVRRKEICVTQREALSTYTQVISVGASSHFPAHEPTSDQCGDTGGVTLATEQPS